MDRGVQFRWIGSGARLGIDGWCVVARKSWYRDGEDSGDIRRCNLEADTSAGERAELIATLGKRV